MRLSSRRTTGAGRRSSGSTIHPPPPPSPPPPMPTPQFNVFGGMPIMHYRPLYEIVEKSYQAPVQTLKDIFDEHIANHSYNATVKQLDDNTYRVILDMKNDNVANLTAHGISQAFMNHLRSHTGLELTLDDEVFRGWRTMCNGTVASPPTTRGAVEHAREL